MLGAFHEDGLSFHYPQNWQFQRDDNESGWTVSLQSPDTAFMLISFDSDMPDPEQMADSALQALKEEYPSLEAEVSVDNVAGQPACGHDIRFFSFDLTNTCWTRSFFCGQGTVLVMWQANDLELDGIESVLKAICASLKIDED